MIGLWQVVGRSRTTFEEKGLTILMFLEPVVWLRHLLRYPKLSIDRGCSFVLSLLLLALTGCGADGGQGPMIYTNSIPACGTVSLMWNPVNDSSVVGYYIHYGKQSASQPGSCAYDQATFVSFPQGTVTDLERGLIYYFAVSAYNGLESHCSSEVFTRTPLIDCCPF